MSMHWWYSLKRPCIYRNKKSHLVDISVNGYQKWIHSFSAVLSVGLSTIISSCHILLSSLCTTICHTVSHVSPGRFKWNGILISGRFALSQRVLLLLLLLLLLLGNGIIIIYVRNFKSTKSFLIVSCQEVVLASQPPLFQLLLLLISLPLSVMPLGTYVLESLCSSSMMPIVECLRQTT